MADLYVLEEEEEVVDYTIEEDYSDSVLLFTNAAFLSDAKLSGEVVQQEVVSMFPVWCLETVLRNNIKQLTFTNEINVRVFKSTFCKLISKTYCFTFP